MKARLAAGAVIGFGVLAGMVGFVSTILSFVLQLCALYAGWLLFSAQRRRIAELHIEAEGLKRPGRFVARKAERG